MWPGIRRGAGRHSEGRARGGSHTGLSGSGLQSYWFLNFPEFSSSGKGGFRPSRLGTGKDASGFGVQLEPGRPWGDFEDTAVLSAALPVTQDDTPARKVQQPLPQRHTLTAEMLSWVPWPPHGVHVFHLEANWLCWPAYLVYLNRNIIPQDVIFFLFYNIYFIYPRHMFLFLSADHRKMPHPR